MDCASYLAVLCHVMKVSTVVWLSQAGLVHEESFNTWISVSGLITKFWSLGTSLQPVPRQSSPPTECLALLMNVAYGWVGFKSASELYTLVCCYVSEASGSCHTKVTLEQHYWRKSFISHDVSTGLFFFFSYIDHFVRGKDVIFLNSLRKTTTYAPSFRVKLDSVSLRWCPHHRIIFPDLTWYSSLLPNSFSS
jgi:hypothetical protein